MAKTPIPSTRTPVALRLAKVDDAAFIAEANRRMAVETEGEVLEPTRLRRGVEAVLRDPALGFYLLALEAGRPVGQLMVTYEWSDWRNGLFWWLQSVYVVPERRRAGIFTALYDEVWRRVQEDPRACGLRLYMEHTNTTARTAYENLGMAPRTYRIFEREK